MKEFKICVVEGCDKPAGMPGTAHGFCKTHTSRWYKTGRIDTIKAPYGSGRIDDYGYRKIRVNGKQVREHRYVMEQVLGRSLEPHEVIHHIDGNKLNNDPDNLQICSQSEHMKLHGTFRNETHKECFKCHVIKPRWQFSPATAKNGRTDTHDPNASYCRDCFNLMERATSKERWQKEKDKKGTPEPVQCVVCGDSFIPKSGQKICNKEDCHRKRRRQYEKKHRDSNPEYVLKRQ